MNMAGSHERRAVSLEIRATGRRLEGYAALFDVEARLGDVREVIRRGAFVAGLAGRDILALADHDPTRVLARTGAGTLRLTEDGKGLHFQTDDLPATTAGNDTLELVRAGLAGGMSFGFTVTPDGERWSGRHRELRAVTLHEISVVSAWPAYQGTTVQARAATPRLNAARRYLETVRR